MYFAGKHWGQFRTFKAEYADGRPAIACWPTENNRPWFVISVERWLRERREGNIYPSV